MSESGKVRLGRSAKQGIHPLFFSLSPYSVPYSIPDVPSQELGAQAQAQLRPAELGPRDHTTLYIQSSKAVNAKETESNPGLTWNPVLQYYYYCKLPLPPPPSLFSSLHPLLVPPRMLIMPPGVIRKLTCHIHPSLPTYLINYGMYIPQSPVSFPLPRVGGVGPGGGADPRGGMYVPPSTLSTRMGHVRTYVCRSICRTTVRRSGPPGSRNPFPPVVGSHRARPFPSAVCLHWIGRGETETGE